MNSEPSGAAERLYGMESLAADTAELNRLTRIGDRTAAVAHPLRTVLSDPETLGRLLRFAVFVTGSSEQGEDVCGEVVARVWERAPRYRADDPEQFLRRAIVNEARSLWRRLERRRRPLTSFPIRSAPDEASEVDSALTLETTLSGLRPLERAVLVARYVDDLSEADTAALLGVSIGTVKSAGSRARERVQSKLERGAAHDR